MKETNEQNTLKKKKKKKVFLSNYANKRNADTRNRFIPVPKSFSHPSSTALLLYNDRIIVTFMLLVAAIVERIHWRSSEHRQREAIDNCGGLGRPRKGSQLV